MRKIVINATLFLLSCGVSKKNMLEKEIVTTELNKIQSSNKERKSICVAKEMAHFDEISVLYNKCINMDGISLEEANTVFKNGNSFYTFNSSLNVNFWDVHFFNEIEVSFYESNVNKTNENGITLHNDCNSMNVIYMSKPYIRSDKKFALIITSSESNGGVLNIYNYHNKKWVFYKSIQIYLS